MQHVITGSSNWVLLSSRAQNSKMLRTLCSHSHSRSDPSCPMFNVSSIDDPTSHFNQVVDGGYHWIIMDTGKHEHIAVVELADDWDKLKYVEIFVRSAPLPNWLTEGKFSSASTSGYRAVYYGKATEAEKMLWCKCESIKDSKTKLRRFYAECNPYQKTRWIMLRQSVHTEDLEKKYILGYSWVPLDEKFNLDVRAAIFFTLPPSQFNCLTMHHPQMGPEYADYWEDQYSFDSDGQPQDPPVMTPADPQFKLPLVTHDSINPDEQFIQEDWDVEPCGEWELMEHTTIIGVPAKLKITFKASHDRGESCNFRAETIRPKDNAKCFRDLYFRIDHDGGEVIHYPDFGRSYDLTGNMKNCQFVCAIARECKAFEFAPMEFCQLHLISYQQESMYAYAKNSTYGRKSENMRTNSAFTWNNAYHPYYRLLQDLLTESGFTAY